MCRLSQLPSSKCEYVYEYIYMDHLQSMNISVYLFLPIHIYNIYMGIYMCILSQLPSSKCEYVYEHIYMDLLPSTNISVYLFLPIYIYIYIHIY